ncbi:MAG TPA: hypothetical protein VID28_06485 [Methylomirabilota bacterium]|jgi:hypothetical protein
MKARSIGRLVGIALAAVAAAACARGPVTGRVTMPGQPESGLRMSWESGLFGESGSMAATMPDGERFKGTYQVVRANTPRSALPAAWTGDEPIEHQGQIDGTYWAAGVDHMAFVSTHRDRAIGTLKGDRGATMLCRFNLMDAAAGIGGGGTGECQTSRGARITAQF